MRSNPSSIVSYPSHETATARVVSRSLPHKLQSIALILAGLTTACGDGGTTPPSSERLICTIPTEAIFAGQGRDVIPAIDFPHLARVDNAAFMRDDDRVLGIEINGEARAYPFGILWWHEVVNDTVGGDPVLVTYCPLTASGIAFDPRIDNVARRYAVSGLLYLSNLIMFDRESNSLWNQMGLGAQCGPDRGLELPRVAVTETDWLRWKTLHPNTTVMTPNTGFERAYFEYPYVGYDDPTNAFVDFLPPDTAWSSELLPKELVLGVFHNGESSAYPLLSRTSQVRETALTHDDVGGLPVLVVYQEVGTVARAFDRRVDGQPLTFTLITHEPLLMVDEETESEWNDSGTAISGPLVGERLRQIADSFVAFWFAWSLYFPNIRVVP